jgi:hypothetical protein
MLRRRRLDFLNDNEMVCVVRAHEVQKDGYRYVGAVRWLPAHADVPACIAFTILLVQYPCASLYSLRKSWLR